MSETKSQALNFINGEEVPAKSGATTDIIDPSTGEVYATAALSGAEDIAAATAAAARAFEGWGNTTPSERSLALLRIADAIEEHAEELVAIESRNTGKPVGQYLHRSPEDCPLFPCPD